MKKILFLLFLGGALFMASCTKQYNTVPNQTVYYDLTSSQWTTSDTTKDYTVGLNSDVIDNYFNNHGAVLIYLTFDNGVSYEQIPEVYNNVSFTYTYTAGGIELYAQKSDGTKLSAAPDALTAKVVFVPSN